jgi:hypothetical protein
MSCSGLANVLSGVALMCANLIGTDLCGAGGNRDGERAAPRAAATEVCSTSHYAKDEPLAFEHADKRVARAGPKAIPNPISPISDKALPSGRTTQDCASPSRLASVPS